MEIPPEESAGRVRGRMPRVKRLIRLAVLLAYGALRAQTAEETPVALSAEPSHHLVLTNAHVRVFRVEVAPHAATLLHRHDVDYLWVALGQSDVTNAVLGKPEVRLAVPDATVRYTRGGFSHVARNESETSFRNVTLEILRPQTGARNLCDRVLADEPTNCPATAGGPAARRAGHSMLPELETDQTRISLLRLEPRAKFTLEASQSPPLLVALEGTEAEALVRIKAAGVGAGQGARRLHAADVLDCPAGVAVELRNTGRSPARFLWLEFRGD